MSQQLVPKTCTYCDILLHTYKRTLLSYIAESRDELFLLGRRRNFLVCDAQSCRDTGTRSIDSLEVIAWLVLDGELKLN